MAQQLVSAFILSRLDYCNSLLSRRPESTNYLASAACDECSGSSHNEFVAARPSRRSRSFKVTDFGISRKLICDFLLVINGNLPFILHRFRDIAFEVQNRYIWLPLFGLTPPTERFLWDDLRKILPGCQRMANVLNDVEILPKISIA